MAAGSAEGVAVAAAVEEDGVTPAVIPSTSSSPAMLLTSGRMDDNVESQTGVGKQTYTSGPINV